MSSLSGLIALVNGNEANATQVDSNFDTVVDYVNNNCIVKDGTLDMTQPLTLSGNPTADLEAAPKQYVDAILPVGMISPYGGASAPSGWLLCDGSEYDGTTGPYQDLGSILGTSYNTGGETAGYFRVPDMRGRFPAGKGLGTWCNQLWDRGGSKDAIVVQHNHTATSSSSSSSSASNQSASHTHSVSGLSVDIDHGHGDNFSIASESSHTHGAGSYDADGTDGKHNHIVPTRTVTNDGTNLVVVASPAVTSGQTAYTAPSAGSGGHSHTVTGTSSAGSSHTHTLNGAVTALNQANEPVVGTLGNQTASHSHTITTTTTTTTTVNNEGVAGTDANLPPYITVNYIIRY